MGCGTDPIEEDFISSVHSGHEQNATTSSPQQGPPPREPTRWHWRKGVQLGKGAYGVVHLAHLVDTGQLVAVKQVGIHSAELQCS
jgi:serine/threonine protein kinase